MSTTPAQNPFEAAGIEFAPNPRYFKVGYVGHGGTRHLLYSWDNERGTWRPACNSNVDYRRVSTTCNPISECLIGCQRCSKHAWLKLALVVTRP